MQVHKDSKSLILKLRDPARVMYGKAAFQGRSQNRTAAGHQGHQEKSTHHLDAI